jgi:uncharacterized lipoprotein YajG
MTTASVSQTLSRSFPLLAATLLLAACQSVPVPVCPKPKEMPELVRKPVPQTNQLDDMKKLIERYETSF